MIKPLKIGMMVELLLAPIQAKAQAPSRKEEIPLPPPPIVARAPASASWKIIYTPETPTPPPALRADSSKGQNPVPREPVVKQVVVVKAKHTYHENISYDDGLVTDIWWVNGMQVTLIGGQKNSTVASDSASDSSYVNFATSDFPDLQWVGASNYVGIDTIKGTKYFLFRKKVSLLSESVKRSVPIDVVEGSMVDVSVWIDVTTRLPFLYAYKGLKEMYLFEQSPSAELIVPLEVSQKIEAVEAAKARLLRPPPVP